jgi:hypothetical protein
MRERDRDRDLPIFTSALFCGVLLRETISIFLSFSSVRWALRQPRLPHATYGRKSKAVAQRLFETRVMAIVMDKHE